MYEYLISFQIIGFLSLFVAILNHFKIGIPFTNQYYVLTKEEKRTFNLDKIYISARNQLLYFFVVMSGGSLILYYLNLNYLYLLVTIVPFLIISYSWFRAAELDIDRQRKNLKK